MRRWLSIIPWLCLLLGATQAGAFSSPELTLSGRFGEDQAEGLGDVLIPVWGTPDSLLFLNPRSSFSDNDEQEINLGLGYRQMVGETVVLGANVFYDSRWTENDNQFDQLGLGLEVLGSWVDARINGYFPEEAREVLDEYQVDSPLGTTTSTSYGDPYATGHRIRQKIKTTTTTTIRHEFFEEYETTLEGWDAELGLRLPLPEKWNTQLRLFGGYYAFEATYGDYEVQGWKGRAELRLGSHVLLDGEVYEDSELNGTDWFAGARVRIPLGRGKEPGEESSRLTEMVVRDPQVRVQQDVEKTAERLEKTRETETKKVTLLKDINFVDDEAGAGGQGTAEEPYLTIQQGVDTAFGEGNVYVKRGTYTEDVTVNNSVSLYGQGEKIRGYGGKSYGGGRYPVLNGQISATAIPRLSLAGMEVQSSGDGVSIQNVSQIDIHNNTFRNTGGASVRIVVDNTPRCTAAISGNRFLDVETALFFDGHNNYALDVSARGNTFWNMDDGHAIGLRLNGTGRTRADISNNRIEDATRHGIFLMAQGDVEVELSIRGNRIADVGLHPSGFAGVQIFGYQNSTTRLLLKDNLITGSGDEGIQMLATSTARVSAGIRNNRLLGNNTVGGADGVDITTFDSSQLWLQLMDNVSDTSFFLDRWGGTFHVEDTLDTNVGGVGTVGVTIVPYGSCNTP